MQNKTAALFENWSFRSLRSQAAWGTGFAAVLWDQFVKKQVPELVPSGDEGDGEPCLRSTRDQFGRFRDQSPAQLVPEIEAETLDL